MKNSGARRSNSFRCPSGDPSAASSPDKPSLFWLLLHALCCLFSLALGFRFSRLLFFLIFSPVSSPPHNYNSTPLLPSQTLTLLTPPKPAATAPPNLTASRVVVGRHGILIRPWPHPDPAETMRAHRIMERVQQEQRAQYGVKSPRPVIVVTPTYVRTFQTLHLTGLMHTLMLVPYDLTWIVVEAGGITNETADLMERSKLRTIHLGFHQPMPIKWSNRHKSEALMRIQALRVVRDRKLDGIVLFADDSNMHSLELFDEIQKVKWVGAVSVGILAHSGNSEPLAQGEKSEEDKENMPVPIQGPACNSSNQLVGWHTFNSLPFMDKSATFVGDVGTVLPTKMEWAGFVLNSRLVWEEAEGKPRWARDLDSVGVNGEEVESPLVLLKDAAGVEPLGSCGKKVLLWWLRVEARSDSKFPSGIMADEICLLTCSFNGKLIIGANNVPTYDGGVVKPFMMSMVMGAHIVPIARRDRQGRPRANWALEHACFAVQWNQRADHIQDQRHPATQVDEYIYWYWGITRRWIITRADPPITYMPRGYIERDMISELEQVEGLADQGMRAYNLDDTRSLFRDIANRCRSVLQRARVIRPAPPRPPVRFVYTRQRRHLRLTDVSADVGPSQRRDDNALAIVTQPHTQPDPEILHAQRGGERRVPRMLACLR